MSEYHDPTYQEAYPAGARAHGGEAVYGDDGVAYGDDGVAYGDEGAAYGDDGPAYGDQGPAYGDNGATGYGSEYDPAAEYDPYADPDQLYADDGIDPYADEYDPDVAAPVAPAGKGKGKAKAEKGPAKPKKPLILAAVGLALVGALGAGGYFLFMAPGGEGGEGASPGFDLSSLTKMIPFMGGPKDNEETVAASQANLMAIKRAVDSYARDNGKLPSTTSAIESQLETLGIELASPYDAAAPVAIELGETPSAPGAIAYTPKGGSYELRVGDAGGRPLMEGDTELVMNGTVPRGAKPAAMAAAPTAGAKPAAAPTAVPTNPPGMAPDDDGYIPQPSDEEPVAPAVPAAAGTAMTAPATMPVAMTPPRPVATPSLTPIAQLRKRNQDFDRLRNEGIGLLYQKRTAEAIVAFRRALLIKPNDVTVRRWLETIQGVVDKHTLEKASELRRSRSELLQKARMVAPPPAPVPDAQRRQTEAMKLLDELKDESAPELAAPKLDD